MKNIIENSLVKSYNYEQYKELISNLLLEGKSTGSNQTQALTNYSLLNDRRMKRLDKTIQISEETLSAIKLVKQPQTWLVLTEGWCGDAAQNLPVIQKIAALNNLIHLKLVLRDENPELMNLFLTNGSKSIPKLIALNENNEVLFTWGPRPNTATQMVKAYKEKHGSLDAKFKQDLQVWYNKNKGKSLQEDFVKLITEVTPSSILN